MSGRAGIILRDAALWTSAAALVLSLHGGAVWLIHQAKAAAPPGLPDPVFVELAPMPTAAAPTDEIEQEELAEAAPEPEPEAEPDPEPEPEPEPTPDFAMPDLQQLEELPDMNSLFPPPPDAVALQKSARPRERPEPPPKEIVKKEPEKRREPKRQRAEQKAPEKQQARSARTAVKAPQGQRSAAPQAGASASPRQVASWQSKVQSAVARHMRRARISGRGGSVTVNIRFSVSPNGQVAGARLASSTGDARIDQALSRQASRMPRLPAPPTGKTMTLVLPVQIRM